jgi:predicted porin
MKKLLIATAALAMVAGTAQAQSSVTVYGAYGNGVTSSKEADISKPSTAQNAARDHLYTTNLGFTGTEVVNNDVSVFFRLEGDLSGNGVLGGSVTSTSTSTSTFTGGAIGSTSSAPATGTVATTTTTTTTPTNIFNRHAHVGLTSKQFGTLTIGRQNDSVKDTEGLAQVYNLSDNLANKTRIGDRIANAYKYATPTFMGLNATYTYSNNPADALLDASNSSTDHNSYAINYKLPVNGGVDLAYAYGKEKNSTTGVQSGKTTRISARTNVLGDLTIGAAYTTNEAAAGSEKTKQTLVNINKPFGNVELKAHYWKNDAAAGVGNSTDGFDGDGYGAMAVYNFSKRTAVYAGYSDFSATLKANEVKVTTVGLFHKF